MNRYGLKTKTAGIFCRGKRKNHANGTKPLRPLSRPYVPRSFLSAADKIGVSALAPENLTDTVSECAPGLPDDACNEKRDLSSVDKPLFGFFIKWDFYGTIALSISLHGPFSPFSFCQQIAT